ncbi:MAG TPA: hypothetical protein VKT77_08475 [Chthonomonadaceae bacterium]|nr:hypothetical protein [Chthonomonadaceae bacterium]
MATSAGLARQDATMERAAASNATFAATMITVLGVTIAVALVVYFAWWQPAHRTDVSTNTLIRTDKTIEKTSAPQTVVVKPDNVNVRVTVPESKPKPAESPKPDETPPAESQPAPDKTDPPSTDGDKAPESKNAPDNP